MIDLQTIGEIVGFTSIITCAYTTGLILNFRTKLKEEICTQITDMLVRLKVIEKEQERYET